MFNIFKLKKPVPIISDTQMQKGTGLIDEKPRPSDFLLGGENQALRMILSENRDYSDYLPINELQKKGYDSYSCVVFSGLNNLEIIFKKQFGREVNYSDRFQAGMVPVIPNRGTTYSAFWDSVRANGLVLEKDYPWGGNTGQEYVQRPRQEIIEKGKIFLKEFEVQHDWVDWNGCNPNKLYDALIYGPLQVTVNANATFRGIRSRYVNHSVSIYGAVKYRKFKILDHYSRATYDLPWNFYFGSAKQATLIKKKKIQLIQVPFLTNPKESAKVYAVYGGVACHIANEHSWIYGYELGIWDKDKITPLSKRQFDNNFTIGEKISFK